MCADVQSKPGISTSLNLWVTIYISLLTVLYLLGYVPIWLKSREYSRDLLQAERQLSLASMQNSLVSAIIHAQSDDYESAQQAASAFFTSLRATTDIDDDLALSPAQREALFLKWGVDLENNRTEVFFRHRQLYELFNDRMLRTGDVLHLPYNAASVNPDYYRIVNATPSGNFRYIWLYFTCQVEVLTADITVRPREDMPVEEHIRSGGAYLESL